MRRYTDTFLRCWTIAILPILLLPIGSLLLLKSPPTAYGVANIWVDQPSLQQLAYVNQGLTPAQNMANYLSQLLLSPSFDMRVVGNNPLYFRSLSPAVSREAAVTGDLSANATATANGPNLVTVAYTTKDPAIGMRVVRGILNQAALETAQLSRQQAIKNIAYDARQVKSARAQYTTAASNLGAYMSAHNIKSSQVDLRQLYDPTLALLYESVQGAQTAETSSQQQLAAANTQEQQAFQNSFRIIDPPAMTVAKSSKKKQLTGLAIPLVLGLVLGIGFIVFRTLRDRSLRYADEVPELLGLPVLTVIPFTPALARSGGQRGRRLRAAGEEH